MKDPGRHSGRSPVGLCSTRWEFKKSVMSERVEISPGALSQPGALAESIFSAPVQPRICRKHAICVPQQRCLHPHAFSDDLDSLIPKRVGLRCGCVVHVVLGSQYALRSCKHLRTTAAHKPRFSTRAIDRDDDRATSLRCESGDESGSHSSSEPDVCCAPVLLRQPGQRFASGQ